MRFVLTNALYFNFFHKSTSVFFLFSFTSCPPLKLAQTLELCDLVLDPFTVKVSRTIGDVIYF